MFWFWETNCCKCEFTNELRNHREEIQIVCNHIAVEIRPYFLFRPDGVQSAAGRMSERLFCAFTDAGDSLSAVSIADLIFRPENKVNTYACSRVHCSVFRYDNELYQCFFLSQTPAVVDFLCNGY